MRAGLPAGAAKPCARSPHAIASAPTRSAETFAVASFAASVASGGAAAMTARNEA